MKIRGWVYVITNLAMPGLVKIGFTTKDPLLRAAELNGTGNPHPYKVEFDILVTEPRDVEQRAHLKLASKREGKEWFRCSIAEAAEMVKNVALNNIPITKEVALPIGRESLSSQWPHLSSSHLCPSCNRNNSITRLQESRIAKGVARCACGSIIDVPSLE